MSLLTDLIAARDLIDTPEKWTKGIDQKGCAMCALWAVSTVTNPDASSWSPRWDAAAKALAAAVPSGVDRSLGHPVVAFNDADDTTHADIMALYDRAIATARRPYIRRDGPVLREGV
jgi:hypothetical protein